MKKIILMALAAMAFAVAVPSLAGAVGQDVRGPVCADIISGAGGYAGTTAGVVVETAAPSCKHVTYTLVALDERGGEIVGTASVSGNGTTNVPISATINDDDDNICVYVVSTAGNGPHVFDAAPDAECVDMPKDAGGGLGGFS